MAANIRMPQFWSKEPDLYFANVEATFFLHKVDDDITKFQLVIGSLGPEELKLVRPLLDPTNTNRTYAKLKQTLIDEFSQSKQAKIKTLLSQLKLDNQQPTTLLRRMRELAEGALSDEFLKTLFLNQLPQFAQSILAISNEPLDSLAKQADQIISLSVPQQYETHAVSKNSDAVIAALSKKIDELTIKVDRLSRSNSRSRNHFRNRSFTPRREPSISGMCYYHEKFKSNARRCRSPCNFKESNDEKNE